MRIAIVDDLDAERAQLKERLMRQLRARGTEAELLEFDSGEAFLAAENEQRFSAAFLDIYMEGLSGMEAAKELEGAVSVRVINVSTIKPMDLEAVRRMADGCRAVVTAEEHNVRGGLGSALAEVLCREPKPMKMVGIQDTFGCSGHNYQEVLEYHGLTKSAIAEAVREMAGI